MNAVEELTLILEDMWREEPRNYKGYLDISRECNILIHKFMRNHGLTVLAALTAFESSNAKPTKERS